MMIVQKQHLADLDAAGEGFHLWMEPDTLAVTVADSRPTETALYLMSWNGPWLAQWGGAWLPGCVQLNDILAGNGYSSDG